MSFFITSLIFTIGFILGGALCYFLHFLFTMGEAVPKSCHQLDPDELRREGEIRPLFIPGEIVYAPDIQSCVRILKVDDSDPFYPIEVFYEFSDNHIRFYNRNGLTSYPPYPHSEGSSESSTSKGIL